MGADWSVLLRPTVRRILDALLSGSLSLTDLAERTSLTKPALQRHLKDLERLGVVGRAYRPIGGSREVVYTLEGCSLHLELRPPVAGDPLGGTALSWASAGYGDAEYPLTAQVPKPQDRNDIVHVLRSLERGVPDEWPTLFIVLFGSLVHGESTRKSDIDLLLVMPRDDPRLQDRLAEVLANAQEGLSLPLQPFYTDRESFLAGLNRIDAAAARHGVVVHGNRRERELWSMMTRYRTISI